LFREDANGTTLSLKLDAFSSYFVVFRKPVEHRQQSSLAGNFSALATVDSLAGSWTVSFDPKWGGPAETVFPKLESWTERPEEGVKYYSGTATYSKKFDLKDLPKSTSIGKQKKRRLFIDFGDIKNVAEVRLNGKKLGILWCAPWRVEITDAVKPTGNLLNVEVTNLWANRVVHDLNLPKSQRLTHTHDGFRFDMLNTKTPILEAGLLGPVKLMSSE